MDYRWLDFVQDMEFEWLHCQEEGREVAQYEAQARALAACENSMDPAVQQQARELATYMHNAPMRADFAYSEPNELAAIQAARPAPASSGKKFAREKIDLYEQIYGAWLARCAGCLFGQPVEGWRRERIVGLLRDTANYPAQHYMSSAIDPELRAKYEVRDEGRVYGSNHINWINNVQGMPEDDDTNYTVLALKTMETYGLGFTPAHMAESWLMNLPLLHTCTAERVAYRNFANHILPPHSATYLNPYREWIGAQIRADFFGYVALGQPALAAEFAWRDASISHTKNGIYGEMWVAAMLAVAPSQDAQVIIKTGLEQVPQSCRLAEKIHQVLDWQRAGLDWEAAIARIHTQYDEKFGHHWVHTISNAMIVAVALLWGEFDLAKTIGIAVTAGFDTDCNGATAASILGLALGAKALPASWIAPLNDQIISGIDGFGLVKISELARRTVVIAEKVLAQKIT